MSDGAEKEVQSSVQSGALSNDGANPGSSFSFAFGLRPLQHFTSTQPVAAQPSTFTQTSADVPRPFVWPPEAANSGASEAPVLQTAQAEPGNQSCRPPAEAPKDRPPEDGAPKLPNFGPSTSAYEHPSTTAATDELNTIGGPQAASRQNLPAFGGAAAASCPGVGAVSTTGYYSFGNPPSSSSIFGSGFGFGSSAAGAAEGTSPHGSSPSLFGIPSIKGSSPGRFVAPGPPASQSAFGSSLSFGSPFGSCFGLSPSASVKSSFGVGPGPSLFGTPGPPASQSAFGSSSLFGSPIVSSGTRPPAIPFCGTSETEGVGSGQQVVRYMNIVCQNAYLDKSQEELRWEDYQAYVSQPLFPPPFKFTHQDQMRGPQPLPVSSHPFSFEPKSDQLFTNGPSSEPGPRRHPRQTDSQASAPPSRLVQNLQKQLQEKNVIIDALVAQIQQLQLQRSS